MDSKEFKKMFDTVAKVNGFEKAFEGWFKESSECITVLDLQKSNFGEYYELNIKIFIQDLFSKKYIKSKELVKKDPGHIFTRQPNNYKDLLDFDISMSNVQREDKLKCLFSEFIVPFTNKALTRIGIKELAQQGEIILLPAVKEELAG